MQVWNISSHCRFVVHHLAKPGTKWRIAGKQVTNKKRFFESCGTPQIEDKFGPATESFVIMLPSKVDSGWLFYRSSDICTKQVSSSVLFVVLTMQHRTLLPNLFRIKENSVLLMCAKHEAKRAKLNLQQLLEKFFIYANAWKHWLLWQQEKYFLPVPSANLQHNFLFRFLCHSDFFLLWFFFKSQLKKELEIAIFFTFCHW